MKFGMWGTNSGEHLHSEKLSSFEQAALSYVYAKIAFLFFLSIYSWVWRAGFFGCTAHYHLS